MFEGVPAEFATMDLKASLSDKNVEKAMIAASKVSVELELTTSLNFADLRLFFCLTPQGSYKSSVEPTTACVKRLGNLYTASLYGSLASLLSSTKPEALVSSLRSLSRLEISRLPDLTFDLSLLRSTSGCSSTRTEVVLLLRSSL